MAEEVKKPEDIKSEEKPVEQVKPAEVAKPTGVDQKVFEAERAEKVKIQAERDKAIADKKALEDKIAAAEAKKLEEEGKFKELAEQERTRREAAEAETANKAAELDRTRVDHEVRLALIREGVIDEEVALLLDR